jgi:hypothetical protein
VVRWLAEQGVTLAVLPERMWYDLHANRVQGDARP